MTSRDRLSLEEALSSTASSASKSGFFFDFDGTIAPIMVDPETVYPVPGVISRLGALAELAGRVGIVSARPAEFLRSRFSELPDVPLYGLYGLQSYIAGQQRTDPEAEQWAPVMARLAQDALRELPAEAFVEDKGIAVALHYRRAPALRTTVERWAAAKVAELGVTEQHGRMVVEIKPPVTRDKGTTIAQEISSLRTGWYFGDDLSDAKAFHALTQREERDPDFTGVRVAVANGETGAQLAHLADITVDGPDAVPAFLDRVIAVLSASCRS